MALVLVLSAGCGPDEPDGDADGDADHDGDADTDLDGDEDGDEDGDTDGDAGPLWGPTVELDRFCEGHPWQTTLTPAVVGELGGEYQGRYADLPDGTLLAMKFVPDHPFQVTTVRFAVVGAAGPVRVRLTGTFGRTYPDIEDGDLIAPIEMQVEETGEDAWIEADVTDQEVYLLPTQHYHLVYEQLSGSPDLAIEDVPEGEFSRALMLIPGELEPYAVDGNFRMELGGSFFCAWPEEDLWFAEQDDNPFAESASYRAGFGDIDGDGHDDLLIDDGRPTVYLGDGEGGWGEPPFDPFPELDYSTLVMLGDVDNDGDQDAFSGPYVGVDDDGDRTYRTDGDCNDTDPDISPDEGEDGDNLIDDDCDGVADDGTDTSDHDEDGVTIAAGDCDDTRPTVAAGSPELLDGLDNDCDGDADEDFVNHILLNDGTGSFTTLEATGVELLDQSTAAAFGDGNGDGALDIYWGNWLVHYPDDRAVQGSYFEGEGDGTFVARLQEAGLRLPTPFSCYGVTWCDYDNDGHQDIYVSNYHLYANQLWHNLGDGTFEDLAVEVGVAYDDIPGSSARYPGGHSYGADFGDIDNDGDMDFFLANLSHPRTQPWADPSMLNINQGPPDYAFLNRREELGFIYDEGDVGVGLADYDNDMDLDVAIATLYTGHFSKLYRNDGASGFTDVTYETGTAVHDAVTVIWTDFDEDGDPDLLVADRDGAPGVHLFENRVGQERNWVELRLRGTDTNRDAAGARVTLEAGGVVQMRDVRVGGGNGNAQPSLVVHFGLADVAAIDDATVRWVGGDTETIDGLAPNGRYLVVEGSGTAEPIDG